MERNFWRYGTRLIRDNVVIVTILLWSLIFCVTHIYGAKIIVTIGIERNFYLGNLGHACIQWLGLLSIGALGLLTTILFPTAGGAPQCIILLLACIFCLKPAIRTAAIDSIKASITGMSAWIPLLLIAGIYTSQPIFLGDSGLYHLSIIRWLTEYGVVTGVAAVHERLGFTSTWFVLPSLFNIGSLFGTIGTLFGGYAFTLYLLLGIRAASDLYRGSKDPGDLALFGISLLVFPYLWIWGGAISPSPDLPVIFIVIVSAGIALTEQLSNKSKLVILFSLGSLALNIKLSLLPLPFFIFFLYVANTGWRPRLAAMLLGLVAVSPLLAVNSITSGYPLFPSSALALNTPWTIPASVADEARRSVFEYAFFGPGNNAPGSFWTWVKQWMFSIRHEWITVTLVACNFIGYFYLRSTNAIRPRSLNLLFIFIICAIAFTACTAPTLRFMIHWIVVLPGIAIAQWLLKALGPKRFKTPIWALLIAAALIASIILSPSHRQKPLYAFLLAQSREGALAPNLNLVASPDTPNVNTVYGPQGTIQGIVSSPFREIQSAGLTVFEPVGGMCWHTALPCGFLRHPVALRDVNRGLKSGFLTTQ